ncbi:MAG: trigger factor, partial [Patescibacteria group bacterium]
MPYTVEKQEDNMAVITLTIPKDEVEAGMIIAAEKMSQESEIKGFRPGKASYDVVKQRFGEMKVLEAAAEELIRNAFVKAMLEEDLETVGQPYFNVEKMAPGNDMIVKAEIALFPNIIKMAEIEKLSVEKKDVEPTQELVDRAKKDLQMMQTKETRAEKGYALQKGDKVVINMTMKKDGVVIEGGQAQDHGIYTAETYFIKGFIDKLIGVKEDNELKFTLKFPEEHYQKHVAGKDIDFEVTIKEIFKLDAPEINDAFAKQVGLKDAQELNDRLKENIRLENVHEETMRQDKAVLDLLAEKSDFEKIPDLLVNQEVEKMLHELKHNVNNQGVEFEQYLQSINKSVNDLKLDFATTALTRIKVAILLKAISKEQDVKVDDKEIDTELDKIAAYKKVRTNSAVSFYLSHIPELLPEGAWLTQLKIA